MKISDPKKLKLNGIKNIIFDWGGVITNLDFKSLINSFKNLGIKDFDLLFSKAYQNEIFAEFEINTISPQQFRTEIRKLARKNLSDSQIDIAWNSILGETPISRIAVLKTLKTHYRTFLLSNTNRIHAEYYNQKLRKEIQIDHSMLFEKAYYSHNIGIRKPDLRIFKYVLNEEGLIAEETLFIDDTEMHVNAAASLGLKAFYLEIEKYDLVDLFNVPKIFK